MGDSRFVARLCLSVFGAGDIVATQLKCARVSVGKAGSRKFYKFNESLSSSRFSPYALYSLPFAFCLDEQLCFDRSGGT